MILRLRDDRGKRVRAGSLKHFPSEAPAEVRNSYAAARSWPVFLLIAALVLSLTVGVASECLHGEWSVWNVIALVSLTPVVPGMAWVCHAMWRDGQLGGRAARDACLRADLCAGCFYDLAASARESDGCVVCPECGAAWRVEKS